MTFRQMLIRRLLVNAAYLSVVAFYLIGQALSLTPTQIVK